MIHSIGLSTGSGDCHALLGGALRELCDPGDVPMPYLVELHSRPTDGVFRAAAARLGSADAVERTLGAWILRELGPPDDAGRRPFSPQAIPLLMEALRREREPRVERALLQALAFNHAWEALPEFLSRTGHPDPGVRETVAFQLPSILRPGAPEPGVAQAFLALASDPKPDVRYYAVYAITEEGVDVDDGTRSRIRQLAAADTDQQIKELGRRLASHGQHVDDQGSVP